MAWAVWTWALHIETLWLCLVVAELATRVGVIVMLGGGGGGCGGGDGVVVFVHHVLLIAPWCAEPCRCGQFVCEDCSRERMSLPAIGVLRRRRVCDRCAEVLHDHTLQVGPLFQQFAMADARDSEGCGGQDGK